MNPFALSRRAARGAAISLCAAVAAPLAMAQAAAGASPSHDDDTPTLADVTVTGTSPGAAQAAAPAARLAGDQLLLKSNATLGDTLNGLPGVASSYFGPHAGRPVMRGLDGDRVRILQNTGASVDVSALSPDHNAPIDPLAVERIDVLRGPAALQYGGNPMGGVVNLVDNRIPTAPINGFTGRADTSYATGGREGSAAALLEGGTDRYALHVDAFSRGSGDVAVPRALACGKPGAPALAWRICNSANRAQGGAVGGSVFFDRGYLGLSAASYRSDYGTVAEDAVTIGMRSTRLALEGLVRLPDGWIESLKGQLSHGDYRHTEYEGPDPGTVFSKRGTDLRLEARHRPLAALKGVWGLQWEGARLAAQGDEAFVPPSRTRGAALFAHEELTTGWGQLSFGARAERLRVSSSGSADADRFVPGDRVFTPASAALGALVHVAPRWQLTGHLAHTQRAPKDYELFANGPHVATAAWETGNPALSPEKSTSVEVGAKWQDGPHRFAINAFAAHFSNYIALMGTGRTVGEGDKALPEFAYTGVRARFIGMEASGTVRLWGESGAAGRSAASVLDLDLRGDLVRATNLSAGQPLPRIAPARIGATLRWAQGPWGARIGVDHAAAQNRVPLGDRATGAYTLWNAAVTYRQKLGQAQLQWFARVDNLTDRLAYSATSVLTTTAFPKAPLPGRSVRLGVQAVF